MSSVTTASPSPPPGPRRRNWRRWLARALIGLLVLLILCELVARYGIGLGDPPLFVVDAEMEYRMKPSMTYRRRGNQIHFNAYSMRSEDFPAQKSSPGELRVMIIGDSIVNGGAQLDDSQLATRLLETDLSRDLNRATIVGNISAASWGPPNMLAYAKKFGLFDADVVVIVLSSHDYADVPTFRPVVDVDPAYPGHRPWCALQEIVSRYLWQRIFGVSPELGVPDYNAVPAQKDIDQSLQSLRDLIALAEARGAKVILAQHLQEKEQVGHEDPGHAMILSVGRECRVPIVQLGEAFHAARDRGSENPWRDGNHPSPAGERLMADLLRPIIENQLRQPSTLPASPATLDSAPNTR